jgi:hypothetical protein
VTGPPKVSMCTLRQLPTIRQSCIQQRKLTDALKHVVAPTGESDSKYINGVPGKRKKASGCSKSVALTAA